MKSKIPPDAFNHYCAQGPQRSYDATAKEFGVSKCAISKKAKKEDWRGRLAKIEHEARSTGDKKLADSLAEMNERHLTLLRAVASRVATALRDHPLDNGMDAIRGVDLLIKWERLLSGEPSKRTEHTFADAFDEVRALVKFERVRDVEPRMIDAAVAVSADKDGNADGERG